MSDKEYYKLDDSFIRIVDLTVHTMRQSWVLLIKTHSHLNKYLEDGQDYPNVEFMKRFVKFSSLVYLSVYSVGTLLCEVIKPEIPIDEKPQQKSKKNKVDPICVVIMTVTILPDYRGINLKPKLLNYTINKVKESKLSKLYAVEDEDNIELFEEAGFTVSNIKFSDFVPLIENNKNILELTLK